MPVAVAVVGPVVAVACQLVVAELAELVEMVLGYSEVLAAETEFESGLVLGLAERSELLVAAVAGGPVGPSRLAFACSGFAADSFGLVGPVGCSLLALENSPDVASLLVVPSSSAVVDAGGVS